MKRAGDLDALRRLNSATVLDAVREAGPISQAQLCRMTGLSRSTVSTIAADLRERGLLLAVNPSGEPDAESTSRQLLVMNGEFGRVVGVVIDVNQVRLAVGDISYRILAEEAYPIDEGQTPEQAVGVLCDAIERVAKDQGASAASLVGVGVGMPSPMDLYHQRTGAKHGIFPGWTGPTLERELSARLGCPVHVGNDADLAALAEFRWGAGQGATNLLYVMTSSGVGAGLILDGRIYRGSHRSAGEIAHVSTDLRGVRCYCGNRGCLGTTASGEAIVKAVRDATGSSLTIDEISARAVERDPLPARVVADAGIEIGRVIAGVCTVLDVDRVVLGGSLVAAGDIFLGPLKAEVGRSTTNPASMVSVATAGLAGREGITGALASVPTDYGELFSNGA